MIKVKKSINIRDESTSLPRWRQKTNTVLIRVPVLMKGEVLALIEGKELTQTTTQQTITKPSEQIIKPIENECNCKVIGYDSLGLPKIIECYYCKAMDKDE